MVCEFRHILLTFTERIDSYAHISLLLQCPELFESNSSDRKQRFPRSVLQALDCWSVSCGCLETHLALPHVRKAANSWVRGARYQSLIFYDVITLFCSNLFGFASKSVNLGDLPFSLRMTYYQQQSKSNDWNQGILDIPKTSNFIFRKI